MAKAKRKRAANKKPGRFTLNYGYGLAKCFLKSWSSRLLIFLLFIIVIGIFALASKTLYDPLQKEFEDVKTKLTKNPTDPELHIDLAQIYKRADNFEKAKEEILVALQYSPNSLVLQKNLEEIEKLKQRPHEVKAEISKWEGVVSLYPNHRDAWFRLSVLYWQIFEEEKSKSALRKTLELNPNFQPAKMFKEFLE